MTVRDRGILSPDVPLGLKELSKSGSEMLQVKPDTHYPYIRPVYTGRVYGPYIRVVCTGHPYIWAVYTGSVYQSPVYTGRIYGPYGKACHAMLFSSTGRIYGWCDTGTRTYGP